MQTASKLIGAGRRLQLFGWPTFARDTGKSALAALALCLFAPNQASAQYVCNQTGSVSLLGINVSASLGAMSCGNNTTASGVSSVAIGDTATISGDGSVGIGVNASVAGVASVGIGSDVTVSANNSTAIGVRASASGLGSVAYGQGSQAIAVGSAAIGTGANVSGNNSTGLGVGVSVSGSSALALGNGASAGGNSGVAVGANANANAAASVAIGKGATAAFSNSVAIGTNVSTSAVGQVALGSISNTVKISGINSTASKATQSGPISLVTTDNSGNLAAVSSTTLLSTFDTTAINNELTNHEYRLTRVEQDVKQARRGVAAAMSLAGGAALPAGKTLGVSANWGTFGGENAFGTSAIAAVRDGVYLSGGIALTSSDVGGRAGVSVAW